MRDQDHALHPYTGDQEDIRDQIRASDQRAAWDQWIKEFPDTEAGWIDIEDTCERGSYIHVQDLGLVGICSNGDTEWYWDEDLKDAAKDYLQIFEEGDEY